MYRKALPILLITLPATATADHLSGGFGLQSASPIWTESASTLKAGKISFGVRSEFLKLRSFSDEKLVQLRKADGAANPEYYDGKSHTIAVVSPDMAKNIETLEKQSSNGMLYSKPNQIKKYVLIIIAICLVAALYLVLNR